MNPNAPTDNWATGHHFSRLLKATRWLTPLIATLVFSTAQLMAVQDQDQESSSRRESEAIKAVEAAGGRVYRISAADTTREVSFNLSSNPIGDDQIKDVNAIGQVIWLNLAGTNVTNEGLKHLAGMPIQKLHLERTQIGDEGLKHLKSFKDLHYLNLYDTKTTDVGLEHLKSLVNLKKLFVWKTEVTESGIKQLQESIPELEIVGELKLEPVVVEEPKKEVPPATEDNKTPVQEKDKNAESNQNADPKNADKPTEKADPKNTDGKADKSDQR